MKTNVVLAQNDELGSIQRCCHGVVHIHCRNTSLRFKEDTFLCFASMVEEASAQLMNRNLFELLSESEDS